VAKVTRLWLQPTSQVAAVGCLLHKEKQLLLYKTQVVFEAPIIIYKVLKSRIIFSGNVDESSTILHNNLRLVNASLENYNYLKGILKYI